MQSWTIRISIRAIVCGLMRGIDAGGAFSHFADADAVRVELLEIRTASALRKKHCLP